MDRFASLWTAEQAAKHILGVNQEQRDDLANRIRAAILHGVIPSQQAQRPLFPALQAVFVAAYLQHGPAASRVMLPREAIRWALAQGDIEVCPECREWYARMVPAAGDPVAAVDPPKVRRSHVDERLERLEQLFKDIERRAKQADIPYERRATPGDKNVLRQFIKQRDPELARMLNSAFADDLKALGVRFLPGNHVKSGRDFFGDIYPETQVNWEI